MLQIHVHKGNSGGIGDYFLYDPFLTKNNEKMRLNLWLINK